MRKRTKGILLTLVIILALVFTFAKAKRIAPLSWGHKEVNQPIFSNQAINDYDAVAYFKEGKAVRGDEAVTHHWKNADWSFSSEENKNLFIENPLKYAPQYGGYCAFAVSKGFTANTDPNSFEIIDGMLYLFNSEDVKKEWKSHLDENLKKGDGNWE